MTKKAKRMTPSERFFWRHSGYVVGRRREGAIQLAAAETHASRMDWRFDWEWGDWAVLSFMGEEDRQAVHEVLVCVVRNARGEVLASLGVTDPDAAYTRVVEAELALEAMDVITDETLKAV